MKEMIMQEVNEMFPDQAFLALEDVAKLMKCTPKVVYNWTRRNDPKRRPPRLVVGKTIRFPKGPFIEWLLAEQSAV